MTCACRTCRALDVPDVSDAQDDDEMSADERQAAADALAESLAENRAFWRDLEGA